MGFQVVQPPIRKEDLLTSDKQQIDACMKKLFEAGEEYLQAAEKLGMNLDRDGFLYSWMNGTRLVVERDTKNEIISMALVAVGQRWNKNDFTASVLELRGNTEPMLQYLKQICAAIGATSMFVEVHGWVPMVLSRIIQSLTNYQLAPDEDQIQKELDKVMALDFPMQTINGVLEYRL